MACCIVGCICCRLVIRIMPPDDSKSQCQLGMKFGCDPNDAGHLLRVAKELDLNVVGVRYCSLAAVYMSQLPLIFR